VQTVVNLLSNAAKFVASGVDPRIRVRTEAIGDRVRFWVEDNGIGIPLGDQERMFRMFERLNVASQYPGTGIGLAIVRRAVERMGGTMGVESNLGEGSRFWIELPRAKDVA
jgi:signal transduction histidine kinase